MNEISHDTGRSCYSVNNTLKALEMGAVEHLIIWEGLDILRYELYNEATGEEIIKCIAQNEDETVSAVGIDADMVVRKKEPLLNWICSHYDNYGCNLTVVSDRSRLGKQFVISFDGVGCILRYNVDFEEVEASQCDYDFDS